MNMADIERNCNGCGTPIPKGRIEALPFVKYCVKCSDKVYQKVDTNTIEIAQSSGSGRNGFAPKD